MLHPRVVPPPRVLLPVESYSSPLISCFIGNKMCVRARAALIAVYVAWVGGVPIQWVCVGVTVMPAAPCSILCAVAAAACTPRSAGWTWRRARCAPAGGTAAPWPRTLADGLGTTAAGGEDPRGLLSPARGPSRVPGGGRTTVGWVCLLGRPP